MEKKETVLEAAHRLYDLILTKEGKDCIDLFLARRQLILEADEGTGEEELTEWERNYEIEELETNFKNQIFEMIKKGTLYG